MASDFSQGEAGLVVALFLASGKYASMPDFKAYVLDTMMAAIEFREQAEAQASG